jgi:hypothetical protein
MVSSILRNGLHINTMISRCRETWAGAAGTRGGGATCAGNPQQYWTFKENICFFGTRVMGVFDGDYSLGGGV